MGGFISNRFRVFFLVMTLYHILSVASSAVSVVGIVWAGKASGSSGSRGSFCARNSLGVEGSGLRTQSFSGCDKEQLLLHTRTHSILMIGTYRLSFLTLYILSPSTLIIFSFTISTQCKEDIRHPHVSLVIFRASGILVRAWVSVCGHSNLF